MATITTSISRGSGVPPQALGVTWTPPGESPRRRLLTVPVALAPGQAVRLDVAETGTSAGIGWAHRRGGGGTGRRRDDDGTAWAHSPGPVWATGRTDIACGDDAWAAQPAGTDLPDPTTGAIVRCAPDGQWLRLDAEGAR